MDKYLWIGGYLDNNLINEINENGGKIMSSFYSQSNLIEGIESAGNIVFDSINSLKICSYPEYKKIKIKKYVWSHKKNAIDINVPYFNFKYISLIFKTISLKKEVKKWIKNNKGNNLKIFVFGMHSPYMKAAVKAKKMKCSAELIIINPDLPQYMDGNPSFIKKILKKIDMKSIYKIYEKFDKHILYTRDMANYLNIDEKKYIVIEGSINKNDIMYNLHKEHQNKFVIMYSGVLGKMYGLKNLVNAVTELGNDYELWLCGTGDLEEFIKENTNKFNNIKYFGYISNREKLLQLQKNSSVLITLINPNQEVSKYCFPSKIFEYMLSGNPVISTNISGIPEEYSQFLYMIYDNEKETIKKKLIEISLLSQKERDEKGKLSREFIINNKNNYVQGEKIYNFITNQ